MITRAGTVCGVSPSATARVWSAQNTRGQPSRMSPWDRGTTGCSAGRSARSPSAVLYMASLAGEEGRRPRRVGKRGAGGLPAGPGKFHGCQGGLVLEEGTGKALLRDLGRGARLRTSPGWPRDEKPPQGFSHHSLLIRELAILDLLAQ